MAEISTYSVSLEDIEVHANCGRDCTLSFLVDHNYLTREQAEEVSSRMAVIVRKPSWFRRILNWRSESENTIRFCYCLVSSNKEQTPDA